VSNRDSPSSRISQYKFCCLGYDVYRLSVELPPIMLVRARLGFLLIAMRYTLAMNSSPIQCAAGVNGVRIHMPVNEFSQAYSATFRMSDGSSIVDSADNDMEHMDAAFHHMKTLMTAVGARNVNDSEHIYGSIGHTVDICGENMTRILMLAVVGNFVSSPIDPNYSSQTSAETLATVVVDYTGSLVVVHSFATMRTYFLESLLFISILAIARLSLVKKVVYTKRC
jgi:hypothetical protein